jgi:hypothetical protein
MNACSIGHVAVYNPHTLLLIMMVQDQRAEEKAQKQKQKEEGEEGEEGEAMEEEEGKKQQQHKGSSSLLKQDGYDGHANGGDGDAMEEDLEPATEHDVVGQLTMGHLEKYWGNDERWKVGPPV